MCRQRGGRALPAIIAGIDRARVAPQRERAGAGNWPRHPARSRRAMCSTVDYRLSCLPASVPIVAARFPAVITPILAPILTNIVAVVTECFAPLRLVVTVRVSRRPIPPMPAVSDRNRVHGPGHRIVVNEEERAAVGPRAIPIHSVAVVPVGSVAIHVVVVVADVIDPAARNHDDIRLVTEEYLGAGISIADVELDVDARPRAGRCDGRERARSDEPRDTKRQAFHRFLPSWSHSNLPPCHVA